MAAMKYGTGDLTGVLKHCPVRFASPALRIPKFISVAKKVYKFFRLDLCLKPNFWHCSCIASICPAEVH